MSLLDKLLIVGMAAFWVWYFFWFLHGINIMDKLKKKGVKMPQHNDLE